MQPVTISQIVDQLEQLSAQQLASVFDYVSFLIERDVNQDVDDGSDSLQTMLASEALLGKDWDRPEEDAAWRDL